MMMNQEDAILRINELASYGVPFVFFTDFLGSTVWIKPESDISESVLKYQFSDKEDSAPIEIRPYTFEKSPSDFAQFKEAYDHILDQIHLGNSFLVNLTCKTPVNTDLTLDEIFDISKAKYKMRYRDQFVCFSPETFIKIIDGHIFSYPMKGTIDASLPNAAETLMNDTKEIAEHITITDLIRNDLSQVAEDVTVTKYRFLTEVKTNQKTLLQASSEISGKLQSNYRTKLGNIIFKLLPAGSISGAPKHRTVKIILDSENHTRGFYTGICGRFDGTNLDSGVMIRFMQMENGKLVYKSGSGITSFSEAEKEYQEIIDKIYVPIH
jgi:para-aminobenzoate synthetase component I